MVHEDAGQERDGALRSCREALGGRGGGREEEARAQHSGEEGGAARIGRMLPPVSVGSALLPSYGY
jgi:hypothetical protein